MKEQKISSIAGAFIVGFITAAAIIFTWATIKNVQFYQDISELKMEERCLVEKQLPKIDSIPQGNLDE